MNFLDRALGGHEQALQVKARRLEVLSQNIANADVPNYKARDLDFKSILQKASASGSPLASTHAGHVKADIVSEQQNLKYRVPFNTSFDGNTVEMSVEQAQYGQAAGQYQATLNFMESRVSSLRRALKGE